MLYLSHIDNVFPAHKIVNTENQGGSFIWKTAIKMACGYVSNEVACISEVHNTKLQQSV